MSRYQDKLAARRAEIEREDAARRADGTKEREHFAFCHLARLEDYAREVPDLRAEIARMAEDAKIDVLAMGSSSLFRETAEKIVELRADLDRASTMIADLSVLAAKEVWTQTDLDAWTIYPIESIVRGAKPIHERLFVHGADYRVESPDGYGHRTQTLPCAVEACRARAAETAAKRERA